MKNILLILKHEYITRVSKKSFIVMTLIGPLLIALFYGTIAMIAYYQFDSSSAKQTAIFDPHASISDSITSTKTFTFSQTNDLQKSKKEIENGNLDFLITIENKIGDSMTLIAKKSISISDKNDLKEVLTQHLFNQNLKLRGLNSNLIDSIKPHIKMKDNLISGEVSGTEIKSGIGYVAAMIIYMFIFMYGVMIMRGVTEEKNNRIVEIIISSVKPFELMMGKIFGIALVGITQFIAWMMLTGILTSIISIALGVELGNDIQQQIPVNDMKPSANEMGMLKDIIIQFKSINFLKITVGFIVFFFGGFLLYSALFAAIGSAVDSETETQQFMLPVSMPLIFGLVIAQMAVIKDPNGTLATVSSMIPFTSPVVMMVRIPFDVSWTEIIISAIILFSTFVLVVWMAAKVYRIGILSYGQKASYKQIWKWLINKN